MNLVLISCKLESLVLSLVCSERFIVFSYCLSHPHISPLHAKSHEGELGQLYCISEM